MNDIRHINGPNKSSGAGEQNSSSSNNNSSNNVDISSISQQFSALQNAQSSMRGTQDAAQRNVVNASNQKSDALRNENVAKKRNIDANAQSANMQNSSQQSKANASSLRGMVTTLKAQADRTSDPRKKQFFLDEARRKELEAQREEQAAQEKQVASEEAQRDANKEQNTMNDSSQLASQSQVQVNESTAQVKVATTQSTSSNGQTLGSTTTSSGGTSTATASSGGQTLGSTTTSSGNTSSLGGYGTGSNAASNTLPGYGTGELSGIKSILNQVSKNSKINRSAGMPHPTPMEAFHRGQSSLLKLAISACDAVITNNVIAGSPLAQAANFLKLQAESILGETQAAIQYWGDMQRQNVQAQKDTHEDAKRA